MTSGAVYIAFGKAALYEVGESLKSLEKVSSKLSISIIDKVPDRINIGRMTNVQRSRWIKVNLDTVSAFQYTIYIDADTRVHQPIQAGFDLLHDGWDMAITPSENQGEDALWHVGQADKEDTVRALEYMPVQLQGGVFWFAKNKRTNAFFTAWREEWLKFKNQDQGALLRALNRAPLKIALLGRPFNGGTVIAHRFGALRGKC